MISGQTPPTKLPIFEKNSKGYQPNLNNLRKELTKDHQHKI